MESFYVEILNPKAKEILKGIVNLNLIRIHKTEPKNMFAEFL